MTLNDIYEKLPATASLLLQRNFDSTSVLETPSEDEVRLAVESAVEATKGELADLGKSSDDVNELLDQVPDAAIKCLFD